MPAKKPRPPDEKPQRDRFIEAALRVGASEKQEDFDVAFTKVTAKPAKPKRKEKRQN